MDLRVIVVDGHPVMRLGLVVLLGEAGMHVVSETGDGEEALRIVGEERSDLVVLGLNLAGGVDGVEACRAIKALPDAPYVLVHTAYDFAEDVSSCFLAGADSYLHKRAECDVLLNAARRTAEGERVWSVGGKVGEPGCRIDVTPKGPPLTPREREVLPLVVHRYSNQEIADALNVSLSTVKNHVRSVLSKLGLKSRRELFKGSSGKLRFSVARRGEPVS